MNADDIQLILESCKTLKNLCDIQDFIMRHAPEWEKWTPTILELMYMEAQSLVEDYCIAGVIG